MNIYEKPEKMTDEEFVESIKEFKNGRIERIISTGQVTEWMDQNEDEYVILVEGEAEIEYEDRRLRLRRGDTVFIPKHKRHRVSYTSDFCLWICIFFDSCSLDD